MYEDGRYTILYSLVLIGVVFLSSLFIILGWCFVRGFLFGFGLGVLSVCLFLVPASQNDTADILMSVSKHTVLCGECKIDFIWTDME